MTLSAPLKMENERQISEKLLTRLKGEYQAKYGFEMDEWTAIMLYEITMRFTILNRTMEASKGEVEKAVQQINGQLTPIHFKDEKQAFRHGLGKSIGVNIAIALTVCVVSFFAFWLVYTSQEYNDKRRIIREYKNIQQYRLLANEGEIIENKNGKYLVLKRHPEKGDIRIGKEYKKGERKDEILVPLGR